MSSKQFILAILIVAVALALVTVPMSTEQGGGSYDPWLDYNEDGKIDVDELHPLGEAYGSSGDSTKNVTMVKHATKVIRVARSVTVPATSSWFSDSISIDGYAKVTVLVYIDKSPNAYLLRALDLGSAWWKADQANNFGSDLVKTYDVMSAEIQLEIYNGAASAATIDINVYLMA